ncbi:hypothetical protein A1351_06610 [Methylosinus sp. R-45379]|nr:hypothetical protein A1351_06610 [Methylosinus sp. R-45379]
MELLRRAVQFCAVKAARTHFQTPVEALHGMRLFRHHHMRERDSVRIAQLQHHMRGLRSAKASRLRCGVSERLAVVEVAGSDRASRLAIWRGQQRCLQVRAPSGTYLILILTD